MFFCNYTPLLGIFPTKYISVCIKGNVLRAVYHPSVRYQNHCCLWVNYAREKQPLRGRGAGGCWRKGHVASWSRESMDVTQPLQHAPCNTYQHCPSRPTLLTFLYSGGSYLCTDAPLKSCLMGDRWSLPHTTRAPAEQKKFTWEISIPKLLKWYRYTL